MKYYLSSYKLGNKPEQLKELFFTGKKIGLIPNAYDKRKNNTEKRNEHVKRNQVALSAIGLETAILDLKDFFGKEKELRKRINELNGVFISGGNTFILRQAMHLSGFDMIIKEKTKDPFFVYAGYSAGICILAKSLDGLQTIDEPEFNPYNNDKTMREGLSLYPSLILPHYKSDHPESPFVEKAVAYCIDHGIVFETLRDGEVIIID